MSSLKKKTAIGSVGVVVIVLLLMLTYIFNNQTEKEYTPDVFLDTPIYELNGSEFEIPKYKDELVFVFFNSNCHFCEEEAENISKNHSKLNDLLVVFVSNEAPELIKKISQNYSNLRFLYDKDSKLTDELNISNYPTTFKVSLKRNTVKKYKGLIDYKVLLANE